MRSQGIADTSSNYGNILFIEDSEQTGKKQVQLSLNLQGALPFILPATSEVENKGKEDIRIPISIEYDRKPHSLEGKAKRVNIAVCEISGCTFPVLISPALSLEFFWRSPLAVRKNAVKIASLGRTEIIKLPAEYIAGSILSLLHSENLIEDRLIASDRNEILVSVLSDVQLVESLIKVKTLCESGKADRFPKLAFSRLWNAENFLNFLNECDFILNPPKAQSSQEIDLAVETAKVSIKIKQAAKEQQYAMPLQTRTGISLCVAKLRATGTISVKAASIFLWLQEGHNYRNMSKEQKAKYIEYLTDKSDEQADKLAMLIASIKIKQVNILEETSVTETVEADKKPAEIAEKKLTLLERLQAAAAKGNK